LKILLATKCRSFIKLAALGFASTLFTNAAIGQTVDTNSVHWAYSSYFGTGWYQVDGDRDVYVFRYTPRWNLQESSIDDDGNRTLGWHLKFPITAGLDQFIIEDPGGTLDPENLASLSGNAALDIEIPVTERWYLRPYVSVGWGSLLDGSESAWTHWAGVKSKYTLGSGRLTWALINTVGYVGYTPSDSASESFWPLMVGLDFEYPLRAGPASDDQSMLFWHATYTSLENDLRYTIGDLEVDPISDQWEVAVSYGKREGRFKIWFLSFDRLGLGYRISSDGQLKGITFVFRSVFDN
jgi:hypothetical protein